VGAIPQRPVKPEVTKENGSSVELQIPDGQLTFGPDRIVFEHWHFPANLRWSFRRLFIRPATPARKPLPGCAGSDAGSGGRMSCCCRSRRTLQTNQPAPKGQGNRSKASFDLWQRLGAGDRHLPRTFFPARFTVSWYIIPTIAPRQHFAHRTGVGGIPAAQRFFPAYPAYDWHLAAWAWGSSPDC